MSDSTKNILIGGEAGQGLATIGQILAKSLVRSGYSIITTQSFESRIRGGHNTFAVRLGIREVVAPQESVDILLALNADTVRIHQRETSPQGCIVVDETFDIADDRSLRVPFKEWGGGRSSNVASISVSA